MRLVREIEPSYRPKLGPEESIERLERETT